MGIGARDAENGYEVSHSRMRSSHPFPLWSFHKYNNYKNTCEYVDIIPKKVWLAKHKTFIWKINVLWPIWGEVHHLCEFCGAPNNFPILMEKTLQATPYENTHWTTSCSSLEEMQNSHVDYNYIRLNVGSLIWL